ncbi:hypothetical protein [Actinosynnema sp. NPDC020468]|uniref:hypothetical protein n=1 Tax=Actinosynnema sp. NPDC020468 TaxID=3154488 RepID=UPI00340F09E3
MEQINSPGRSPFREIAARIAVIGVFGVVTMAAPAGAAIASATPTGAHGASAEASMSTSSMRWG